jgi:hypothetical protein
MGSNDERVDLAQIARDKLPSIARRHLPVIPGLELHVKKSAACNSAEQGPREGFEFEGVRH